jgi:two-component system chemotaxis response regulator CheB
MPTRPVTVAICEDSRVYAIALREYLEADGDLQVVTIAGDAERLLAELPARRPAVVTMDLELPGMDGIEAIRRIMASSPVPIVVLSDHVGRDSRRVAQALAAGALEAFAKRQVRFEERTGAAARALRRRIVELAGDGAGAGARDGMHAGASGLAMRPALPRRGLASVIGIASSAGGPAALAEVLGALPTDFALPVLVVQHMAPGFTPGLADWLDDAVAVPVALARAGETLTPGVRIAPDGAHLLVGPDRRLRLDQVTAATPHRPSGDALLSSLAAVAGRGAVGVVLTGMGRDGAAGVAAVLAAGGAAVTELPEEAAVWGMPSAAAAAGAVPQPRREIGPLLARLAGA